jgi:hypothetical protein
MTVVVIVTNQNMATADNILKKLVTVHCKVHHEYGTSIVRQTVHKEYNTNVCSIHVIYIHLRFNTSNSKNKLHRSLVKSSPQKAPKYEILTVP